MADLARDYLTRLAWVVLAVLVAFGAAGIVAAMDHVPGTHGRPELTWSGDQAARPALDASTARLETLADDVDTLATAARQALAAVVAGDLEGLTATIEVGTAQLAVVDEAAAALETSLAAVPGVRADPALRLSADMRLRYAELAATTDLTRDLDRDWASFTGRALDAASLTGLLARHDQETAAAAKQGAAAHYPQALKGLDKADATLAEARALRDALATTTDVSTLTTWLERNGEYDAALRTLYQSLIDAKGRVTNAVRKAFAGEEAARDRLPGDTRGLVVIMVDIAQGGLNQAVISIEEARGSLAGALDVQRQLQAGPGLPE